MLKAADLALPLLLTVCTLQAQGTTAGALIKTAWKPLATLSKKLAEVSPTSSHLLEQLAKKLQQLQLQQAKSDVYLAAAADNVTTAQWFPIKFALAAQVNTLTTRIRTEASKAIHAASAAEFVRGGITEFFSVATGAYAASSQGCIATTTTANSGKGTAVGTIAGLNPDAPDVSATKARHDNAKSELDFYDAEGIKGLQTTTGIADGSLTDAASCNLFKGGAGGIQQSAAVANTINFALGFLGRHPTDATPTARDCSNQEGLGPAIHTNPLLHYKTLHKALIGLAPKNTLTIPKFDATQLAELKSDPNFIKAAKETLMGIKTAQITTEEQGSTAKINQIYKENQGDFNSAFWEKLTKVKIPTASGIDGDKDISQIENLEEAEIALNYFKQTAHSQTAATLKDLQDKLKTQADKVKTSEEECNKAKDDKDECGKLEKQGCVYNPKGYSGKKCTLSKEDKQAAAKEAENQEADGKEGKPGVNCSSHTTKETCEGVTGTPPTGKAKVCGWIEDKCQDSSFLVYKKFALSVVSAAFAALLF
uniref:Variant surface glycoprotein n=1 Tax=Trypanosoma brucei TaxID=5691 RepID=S5FYN1_9TRYP|nr:variant surface glycoprotein [Trypanosoma brucei]